MQYCNEEYDAERYDCHALKHTKRAWHQKQVMFRVHGKGHHAGANEKTGQVQLASTGNCHIKMA
jgi:hypothetical protein